MTAGLQGRGVISKMTWAVLKDSGWYDLPNDFSEPLVWGKDAGCPFALKHCYEQLSINNYKYVAKCNFDDSNCNSYLYCMSN